MKFHSKQQIESNLGEVQTELLRLETVKFLLAENFEMYLVGGAARDFALNGVLSKDLDIEIQHQVENSFEALSQKIEEQLNKLELKFEKLNFDIFRIFESDYELELSFPRLENYPNVPEKTALRHDEFETEILTSAPIQKTFQRRDFSINAMAIKLYQQSISFEDPYQGLESLAKKQLDAVKENFAKDPVRFIRLIRFQLRFDLNLSDETKKLCHQFNLSKCSDYHFLNEFKKSEHPEFLETFFKYVDEFEIEFPPHWAFLKQFNGVTASTIDEHLYSFWLKNRTDSQTLKDCQSLFKLKAEIFKKFSSLEQASQLSKVPNIGKGLDLEQMTIEEENQLRLLRVLIQNLPMIKHYNIPVFDLEWLQEYSKLVDKNRPSKEELLSAPEKLRWCLPLLKNL